MDDVLVITPSGLLEFLSQISELEGLSVSVEEQADGINVNIGGSSYLLQCDRSSVVEVEPEVVDEIDAINEEGYDGAGAELEEYDSVEGGLLKEIIKTLAIGGLVRMTKNALLKD